MKSENIPNTDLEEEKAKCPTDTADDPHRKAVIEEAVSVKREESEMNIVEIMILRAELEEEKNQHAATVSLYKQLEPFADVAGLAIGDPAGQRFSSTEQQYTTITTIGHEC